MNEDIKVTFIIAKDCPNENECSEEMQLAFIACEQHSGGGLHAKWVHEAMWMKFEGLTKRDVFVLTEFEGELYDKLRATKCLVVGPRCLSCCLTEGTSIPSGPEPVFTVAMRGLVVTASGLTKLQKENVKKKVHWMGGIYNTVLTDDTTHLVSDTVLSDKYIKSTEKGIPIMSKTWVEAVWEASLRINISGSSSEFDSHKLPAFANLQVTTSGISKKDKQMIMKLVNEHGGMFCGAFQSEMTDVVVLNKDGVGSEKYNAALEFGKACVLPIWVKDSAAAGFALPLAKYKVAGTLTSSPFSVSRVPDMSLNFSRITNVKPATNFIDETKASDITTMSGKMKLSHDLKRTRDEKADSSIDKEIAAAFESFDMSTVKKAGPIFDGFCIWVTGLEGVCRERALAIVSRAGGVRYDAAHERVTHVAAGDAGSATRAAAALPTVPVLTALWLIRSVEAGKALNEAEFLINMKPGTPAKSARKPRAEPASPMSERNLQLLRRGPLDLPPPAAEAEEAPQDDLVNHYLSQNITEEPAREESPDPAVPDVTLRMGLSDITEDGANELTEEIEQIFRGVKIEVQGLDEEAVCEIGAEVAAAGGALAAAGAGGSHALVPLDFDTDDLLTADAEPVTVFWVKDCLSQQELLPMHYYHRPVKLPPLDPNNLPLKGVVASLSTYSGVERVFLDAVAKLLGATTQLRFCRRNTANALASTHLICPTASGDKYFGAVKWGLPAVQATWLMECAREGRRLSERTHLVGETKAPPSPQNPNMPVKSEVPQAYNQATESALWLVTNTTDKENAMLPPVASAVPQQSSVPSKEQTPKGIANNAVDEISPATRYIALARQGLLSGDTKETPKRVQDLKDDARPVDEISPASRYIAMARQGLLGGDTQETPKRVQDLKDDARPGGENLLRTPPLDDALSTPNLAALSPTTRRRLQAIRRGEMPSGPIRTPTDPFDVPTPDSAFGAALRTGSGPLSPRERKRLWRVVNDLPGKQPDPARDKQTTPLSEIRNRFLAQFNEDAPTPPSEYHVAPRKLYLQDQADTPPPAKVAKVSVDQSPSSAMKIFDRTESAEPKHEAIKEESVRSASIASSTLPPVVDAQLLRLNAVLSNRLSSQRAKRSRDSLNVPVPPPESEPGPESQPNTVGWDDSRPAPAQISTPPILIKRFMLSSNVDNREEIIEAIQHLGGEVCEGSELDPEATHLLCAAPGRSEKMLGCIAAGRWVLHPAYVARSRAVGSFLPEEQYEWGNPMATSLPAMPGGEGALARAACRWRQARGAGAPGPFAGVAALLHVPPARRKLLARLVEAGDGAAPDDEPPYNNESITVCFADAKRFPLSDRDAAWFKSRCVPVCAPVLLSAFLTDDTPPDPVAHCLPDYRPTV